MSDIIRVGMADYKLCSPPDKISTLGLGSCLGVVLYDRETKICGLAHVMLPDSKKITQNSNRMKFVDTCLKDMYDALVRRGINKDRLVSKIAGGARMFSHREEISSFNVGAQNVLAVHTFLAKHRIPVLAEDVGQSHSRTIVFDPENAQLLIKSVGVGNIII